MRINIYTCGIYLVLSYPILTMHGHMNLKIHTAVISRKSYERLPQLLTIRIQVV